MSKHRGFRPRMVVALMPRSRPGYRVAQPAAGRAGDHNHPRRPLPMQVMFQPKPKTVRSVRIPNDRR